MGIKSRLARREDVGRFFGRFPDQTIKARVLEIDGEIAGVAGYYIANGIAVVFSDIKDNIPKLTIWREAKALMGEINLPAVCVAQEGSGPFLERLGWEHMGPSPDGEVYTWHNS